MGTTQPGQAKLPQKTREEWAQLFREHTDSELAREFKTSVTAVWRKRKKLELPPKQASSRTWSASGYIPWKVPLSEYDRPLLLLLRDAWRLDHDKPVEDPVSLAQFLDFMENISDEEGRRGGRGVVVWDPSLPPDQDRFFIVPWRRGDLKFARPNP